MICALSHYPLDFSGGGSVRAINIWKILAEIYGENVVAFTLASDSEQIIWEGICERHIKKPFFLRRVSGGYLCAFPSLISRKLSSAKIFEEHPNVIILEGPYMGYAVLRTMGLPKSSLIIYDAQNVEANYHREYFYHNPLKKAFLKKIESIERYVMKKSHYIFSTSGAESQFFQDRYDVNAENIIVVPNGVDTSAIMPLEADEKVYQRAKYEINRPLAIFMGSGIKANTTAGRWISDYLAASMPEVTFFIVGNVCNDLRSTQSNVKLLGRLTNSEKNKILQIADVALNPVQFGAGTNVKMLEYLSAGLPIVSTDTGTRGLNLENGEDVVISDLAGFKGHIYKICHDDSLRNRLQRNSRRTAQLYDWKNIAFTVKNRLTK